MDIELFDKNSLKIKGKHAAFVVDASSKISALRNELKNNTHNGVIVLNGGTGQLSALTDIVVIKGPGEYEVGGVKISGIRNQGEMFYNLNVDGIEVLLGKISTLEKQQNKLKDQDIVIVYVDSVINASFVTSLASSVVIYYGEYASALIEKFGKENVKVTQKYTAIYTKLPVEVETVILE